MSSGPRAPELCAVELVEEEYVANRGTASVHWYVRLNDGWVRSGDFAGATSTLLASGPGVVYRRRVELRLAAGTRLMRVESRPNAGARRSTVDHLLGGGSARGRTERRLYEVGRAGKLVPLADQKKER